MPNVVMQGIVLLNAVKQGVVMLNAVMLGVVLLNVAASNLLKSGKQIFKVSIFAANDAILGCHRQIL